MADLGGTFDPNEIPADDRGFEPIPAGDYLCQVTDSDIVDTKAGTGQILKLTIEVVDGPYAERKVFENLNIRNPNPQAQSIAQRALADLCQATGVGAIRDSEDLHFRPFVAKIGIETDKSGQYDPKNKVKRYKVQGGQPPSEKAQAHPANSTAATVSAPAAKNGPAATGSRPWARQTA
jgi:hypothetical protein